jgi:hypothetical protein
MAQRNGGGEAGARDQPPEGVTHILKQMRPRMVSPRLAAAGKTLVSAKMLTYRLKKLFFRRREARQFGLTHTVDLQDLPADLAPKPLRCVLLIVLDFHFDEQIRHSHLTWFSLHLY